MKLSLLSANIRDSDVIKTHQNKCIALKTKLNELNFGSNCLECQIGCLLPYSAFTLQDSQTWFELRHKLRLNSFYSECQDIFFQKIRTMRI